MSRDMIRAPGWDEKAGRRHDVEPTPWGLLHYSTCWCRRPTEPMPVGIQSMCCFPRQLYPLDSSEGERHCSLPHEHRERILQI